MVIVHKSFDHKGGFYHYRVHIANVEKLCNNGFSPLKDYLEKMFNECPDDYFHKGPRSSSLKFKLEGLNLMKVKGHEAIHFAEHGLNENNERFSTNHTKVQMFFMEKDEKSVAVEVPLWFMPEEAEFYNEIFKTSEPLTGHIDLVRIEDGKIWVWDYKPKARLEKFAATQVYFYALMLSARTGIDLENFRCGYFDAQDCYAFIPSECKVPVMKTISEF